MKKILLFTLLIGSAILSYGQLTPAPITTSTSTGTSDGNIAACRFAPGTPQACIHVCRSSVRILPATLSTPDPRTVRFDYYQVTSGAKSLHVIILCGNTILVNDCIDASADNQNVLMYKEYPGIICNNVNDLVIKIQAHTNGSCGGNECGPLLVSIGGSPLPVDFKSFTASRNKSNVMLKWETSTEINSSGFAIERSNDNASWQEIAFVNSQAQGGNSSQDLAYQYIDVNNTKGISQYRIKQVDFDAKSKYTEVRSVKGDGQIGKIIVYPNPTADGKVNIVFDDASVVRDVNVIDMSGRTIRSFRGISNNNITIDNLTPGIYSLRIYVPETGEQAVEKIVVNKR